MAARGRTWLRWLAVHGLPRGYLLVVARRGDPVARIWTASADSADSGEDAVLALAEQVRAAGRLVRQRRAWVTADHAVVRDVLRDQRFGVVGPDNLEVSRPARWLIRRTALDLVSPVEPPAMLMVDPPAHTRYRRLVTQTFTPRAIERYRPRIEQLTDDLLDRMTGDRADLITDFAARLPVAVISAILGMPDRYLPDMLIAGNKAAALLDVGLRRRAFADAVDGLELANAMLAEHVDRLIADPGDDLLSELTRTDLTRGELMSTAMLVIGAGFETTVNLIGNGARLLLDHPDQLDRLRREPDLWPGAIDEILRYDSPVRLTARSALADVEVSGQLVRRRQLVLLLVGGANRDPRVFADPGVFDIGRANSREHLAFGRGIHGCLGSYLAKLQGTIALRGLFDRFPELRPDGMPRRRGLVVLRGYTTLPVAGMRG